MVYSVSDAVRDVLAELTFLRIAIEKDLLNFSAVARFILPSVASKLGVTPSLDAITAAIRRNCEVLKNQSKASNFEALKSSKLILRTDMTMFLVTDWVDHGVMDEICPLFFKVDFKAGEKFYVLTRSNELMLICSSKMAKELINSQNLQERIKFTEKNLSIVTINTRAEAYDVPGILDFYTEKFQQVGVNILETFSTRGKISFLIRQKDAAAAYENIVKSLESIKAAN